MNSDFIPESTAQVSVNEVLFSHGDVREVMIDFYQRIQADASLRIPFQAVKDWNEHIQKLTHFWWVRLGGKSYLSLEYNPVAKHYFAGFNEELLDRWLVVFHQSLKSQLNAKQFEIWMRISQRMGQSLAIKNELYRQEFEAE